MTSFDLTVDTRELRAALVSILPHAGTEPDLPMLMRLRFYATQEGLVVAATDRWTGAMAKVDVDSSARGAELGCFDISPLDAREVLALFKPPKDAPHVLRLQHDGKQFKVTDVSGLFPGKSIRFEAFALSPTFPDIADVIGRALAAVMPPDPEAAMRRWRSGYSVMAKSMAKFSAAGQAFGMDLSVEPTTALPPALVVTCGEGFAGLLIPGRRDDEQEDRQAETRLDWLRLARDVSAAHPLSPEIRKHRDEHPVIDLSDLFAALDNDDQAPTEPDGGES